MFIFRKIWRVLFSWNTRFENRPFALPPTNIVFLAVTVALFIWLQAGMVGRNTAYRRVILITQITLLKKAGGLCPQIFNLELVILIERKYRFVIDFNIYVSLMFYFQLWKLTRLRVVFFPRTEIIGLT